ncbi:MAG: DUF58 domain-containing protein [Planctomycetes bacterium]|nr:DUF58 domain-containing protein [Planctomycetota bacterium]
MELTGAPRRAAPEHTLPPVDPLDTRRYQIAIRRLADTLSHGTDRSRFLGSGLEYVQSRPYVPGDPVRAIDWRVTARTGEVHIKEYEAPKRMPAWILFDTSGSMTLSSTRLSKYQVAAQLAGGLAFACLDRVSPVGLLGTGERDLRVKPSLSKDEVMQWLVKLRTYRDGERTTLARRVTELNARLTNRALVFVLSDLHEPEALDALKLMAQVHDVVVLQLQDPAEVELRGAGFLRAEEAETGAEFVTHGRRQRVDPDAARRELRRGGIDHLLIRTDQPYAQSLRLFLKDRAVLAGGR